MFRHRSAHEVTHKTKIASSLNALASSYPLKVGVVWPPLFIPEHLEYV